MGCHRIQSSLIGKSNEKYTIPGKKAGVSTFKAHIGVTTQFLETFYVPMMPQANPEIAGRSGFGLRP